MSFSTLLKNFGSPAWIAQSTEFPTFLDLVYERNFGEVWLYNNDLKVIRNDKSFRSLYMERIAGSLRNNIDSVKFLVTEECEDMLFTPEGIDADLGAHLCQIASLEGGRERLETFYFGKMSKADLPEVLTGLDDSHTWVFYTHRHTLDANPGIVMVRHNVFPFHVPPSTERFAIVWELRQELQLQARLQHAFQGIFSDEKNFCHLRVKDGQDGECEIEVVPGWSTRTRTLLAERKIQTTSVLALSDSVDIAVLASQDEELRALEDCIGCDNVWRTPLGLDNYYYAVLGQGHRRKTVLLAEIGEGNLYSATRTWDIIDKWKPRLVILLGVAGGDPADVTQNLGDVVIGQVIAGYDHGKMLDGEFKQRSTRWEIADDLRIAASHASRKWTSKEIDEAPGGGTQKVSVHKCAIASGSKLVADANFFQEIRGLTHEKIHAIEMEADGVGHACFHHPHRPGMGVFKSIMDKSDQDSRDRSVADREEWKRFACRTAAEFVYDVLCELT